MSETTIKNKEIDFEQNDSDIKLRADDLKVTEVGGFKVKERVAAIPAIQKPEPVKTDPGADVIKEAEKQQHAFRVSAATSGADVKEGVAKLENLKLKETAKIADFSEMSEDDVYNLDIPMTARPFSNEDSLKVSLLDTNYVARWVNKDPRRLGAMIARGFQYVTDKDLRAKLEVEVAADAEGHYSLGDVILMKITKERYYSALRASHLRAINSVGHKGAHKAAIANANEFMSKETGGSYSEEASAGKVAFYSPNVTI